jgi:FtsH-binding integral membrane protein
VATDALRQQVVPRVRVNPKADRVFFSTMVLLLWAAVLYGFARTYFLAGMVTAPLPNKLIHIHGAIMTLWMVVLFVQTALISARRVKWHMNLGLFGFALALAMVVIGPIAATDSLRRGSAPLGLDAKTFYIIPLSAILVFGVLAFFAYWMRRQPAAHKRLILIASIGLIDAAVGRWPVAFFINNPKAQDLVPFALLLAVMVYDMVTQRRVLKSTLFASLFLIVIHLVRVPIGFTGLWHAFATRMMS